MFRKKIDGLIFTIRGRRVMLAHDLARIYGVKTKRLNEQVGRNRERFPEDFVFRMTHEEARNLRSQIATSSLEHGGRRYLPLAFTEHGAVMLASVLDSPVAVAASIQVVRAFNHLRSLAITHKKLAIALDKLERKVAGHDHHIQELFAIVREFMAPPIKSKPKIGFKP